MNELTLFVANYSSAVHQQDVFIVTISKMPVKGVDGDGCRLLVVSSN